MSDKFCLTEDVVDYQITSAVLILQPCLCYCGDALKF